MDTVEKEIKRPSLFWLLTETGRALFEFGAFVPYNLISGLHKKGDGHPVLVLPGFMTTDNSTKPLRNHIDKLGYKSYGWGIGRNQAKVEYIEMLLTKVKAIYAANNMKVSVIGWSLGGIYARQIAKMAPELVKQVIVLGSPFGGVEEPNHARWMYDLITKGNTERNVDPVLLEDIPKPAPVPTTAIYSKEDGIVPWEVCIEAEDETHQNVRVRGSHIGLGVNPIVLNVIADRLAQDENDWQPFESGGTIENILAYPS